MEMAPPICLISSQITAQTLSGGSRDEHQVMCIATWSAAVDKPNPDVVIVAEWISATERRERGLAPTTGTHRALPHRLERCGYVSVRNPDASDGYWVIGGSRQPVYAKASLSQQEQLRAARNLIP
jgi:hypothetical protein